MKLAPNTGDYRKHQQGKVYQTHIRSYTHDEGDYGPYVLLNLDGGVEDGTSILASATLSKRSKLGGIVAMLYPTYNFEDEFDLDLLIGQPVAVTFTHEQRDDGGWGERATIVAAGDKDPVDFPDTDAPF